MLRERLDKIWKEVIDQHFQTVLDLIANEGQGLAVFKILERELVIGEDTEKQKRCNCHFLFIEKGSHVISHVLNQLSPRERAIVESRGFEDDSTVPISLQIPDENGSTIGDIRIYNIYTRKEIDYYLDSSPPTVGCRRRPKP
jgi:hypothetical protein